MHMTVVKNTESPPKVASKYRPDISSEMVPEDTKFQHWPNDRQYNVTLTCMKQMVGGPRDSLKHESTPQ
jgi:hypothetical protein